VVRSRVRRGGGGESSEEGLGMRGNGREAIERMRQEVVVEATIVWRRARREKKRMRSERQRNRRKDEKSGIVKKKEE